jgi:hypothetical protein
VRLIVRNNGVMVAKEFHLKGPEENLGAQCFGKSP